MRLLATSISDRAWRIFGLAHASTRSPAHNLAADFPQHAFGDFLPA
jgi:hypothetical protein